MPNWQTEADYSLHYKCQSGYSGSNQHVDIFNFYLMPLVIATLCCTRCTFWWTSRRNYI